jgi:alanyl-tRNA synthetase
MTETLYYEDPYLQEADGEIVAVGPQRGNGAAVELDRTIFFPEGGGQPADQGEIETESGALRVKLVRAHGGRILHEGALTGELEPGQRFRARLKWPRRLKYMRVHTAGHLIHDVLMRARPDIAALKGRHGEKAFLEYRGLLEGQFAAELERRVNRALADDLEVRTWQSSYEELAELCSAPLLANLPAGKPLRAIQIDGFAAMPDGGVHVRRTAEIGAVVIHHIKAADGASTIRYGVR